MRKGENKMKTKKYLINAIIAATRNADGDLFFSLAFRTRKELLEICKLANIKI